MHLSRTAAAAAFAMAMAAVSPHVAHAAIDVNPDEFAIALFNGDNFRSRDLFVLENDTGAAPLQITAVRSGSVGTCEPRFIDDAVTATAISWLRDENNEYFSGNTTCEYDACDANGHCGSATVLLKIQPVTAWNDPEAVSGDPIFVEPNEVTTRYNVVDNDSKPDGIQLRVTDVHVVSGPGSCSISSTDARFVVFRRATLDFRATTTVCSYQACTATGRPVYCDSAEVTFTAKALEDIPPFLDATNDRYILPDNQPSSPEGDIKVLLNDGSNRPIRLSPQIVTGPAAGAGTCTVVDDRTRIRYTRPARSLFSGDAVCVYQVCTVPRIGEAQLCQTAILTVVVRQPGSRVIAVNDEFAVNAEVVESRVLPVLANDGTNPPGRNLIVAEIDTLQPDFGRCIISGNRFGIRYRPRPGVPIDDFPAFVQCRYTACTTDTLTPQVCDDATVTINLLIGQTSFPTSTPTRKPTRKPVTKSPGTCCIPKCTFHYDPLKFSIRT